VQKIAVAQNRFVDNTRLYLIASEAERRNLEKPVYAYDDYPYAIQLTGIPRYDGLTGEDRKILLIHPTWRMETSAPLSHNEGKKRLYNPIFKDTEYFRVYNSLITNERLIACAREHGYRIIYVLHPIASAQYKDFRPKGTKGYVEVVRGSGSLNYEEILSESSLMVTDYSGVQFDFAYQRKPVVYYNPESLPPHYEEGTFSIEEDGFGEITTTEDALVSKLCSSMERGCVLEDRYRERIDAFFAFNDRRNCERAYLAAVQDQKLKSESQDITRRKSSL
jgi:CDP-glycerol glycerophosphotransferase (TagB/SpsB family)